MKEKMTPRERVLKAFRKIKGTPDRVPIHFDLCKSLLEHFGKKLDIPLKYTKNLYEDVTYRISGNEIRTAMGSDIVTTGAGSPLNYQPDIQPDGTWLNEYQMRMKQGSLYTDIIEYPLAHAHSAADIKAYQFPNPDAEGRYDDAKALIQKYKEDYYIIGSIGVTVFSLAHQLVGFQKLLLDMAMKAEYIEPLFKACTDFQIEIAKNLLKRGVDTFWVGDDFGTQSGLLISPEMFNNQLSHHYALMNDRLKSIKPDAIPILHCDGAVRSLLENFKEIGFESWNPVQPDVPGHDPQELKDVFGSDLIFWGAIDGQELLPRGTDEELEADIKQKINIFGKNRGFLISPSHILQSDVTPKRVEKFIELCQKHGQY